MADLKSVLVAVNLIRDDINKKMDNLRTEFTSQFTNFMEKVTSKLEIQENRIGELETDKLKLKEEVRSFKEDLSNVETKMKHMENRLIDSEAHFRRLNLIISNVKEEEGENVKDKVFDLFKNELKIKPERVENLLLRDLHRLGKIKTNVSTNTTKHRNIIIAFLKQEDRNMILEHCKNLKDKSVSIKVDLPLELSKVRDELLTKRRVIKDFKSNLVANLVYRAYKPVLIVKYKGSFVKYEESMDLSNLETH